LSQAPVSLLFPDSINLAKELHKNNLAVEVDDISNLFCNATRLKDCVKKLLEGDHEEAEPDIKQLWDYMIQFLYQKVLVGSSFWNIHKSATKEGSLSDTEKLTSSLTILDEAMVMTVMEVKWDNIVNTSQAGPNGSDSSPPESSTTKDTGSEMEMLPNAAPAAQKKKRRRAGGRKKGSSDELGNASPVYQRHYLRIEEARKNDKGGWYEEAVTILNSMRLAALESEFENPIGIDKFNQMPTPASENDGEVFVA
jgi:hypothetical protein